MDIAEANGYKLAILSYSYGVPEYDVMQALVESGLFARAKAGGHILSLHEYASPTNKWYGAPIPGAEQRDDAGPLCTRHRFLYELLEERGQVIPLVITEFNTPDLKSSILTSSIILSFQVIVCVVPTSQLSPPFGTVTVIGSSIVKVVSEKSNTLALSTLVIFNV